MILFVELGGAFWRGFCLAASWLSRQSLAHFFAVTRLLQRDNQSLRDQIATERERHNVEMLALRAEHAAQVKQMLDRLAPPLTENEPWEMAPEQRIFPRVQSDVDQMIDEMLASPHWAAFLAERSARKLRSGDLGRLDRLNFDIETGAVDPMM